MAATRMASHVDQRGEGESVDARGKQFGVFKAEHGLNQECTMEGDDQGGLLLPTFLGCTLHAAPEKNT